MVKKFCDRCGKQTEEFKYVFFGNPIILPVERIELCSKCENEVKIFITDYKVN